MSKLTAPLPRPAFLTSDAVIGGRVFVSDTFVPKALFFADLQHLIGDKDRATLLLCTRMSDAIATIVSCSSTARRTRDILTVSWHFSHQVSFV